MGLLGQCHRLIQVRACCLRVACCERTYRCFQSMGQRVWQALRKRGQQLTCQIHPQGNMVMPKRNIEQWEKHFPH